MTPQHILHMHFTGQDYSIGTARKMSVDIDVTPDLLLFIQQKLCIVQYDTVVFLVKGFNYCTRRQNGIAYTGLGLYAR